MSNLQPDYASQFDDYERSLEPPEPEDPETWMIGELTRIKNSYEEEIKQAEEEYDAFMLLNIMKRMYTEIEQFVEDNKPKEDK